MPRDKQTQGRYLQDVKVGQYTLLNSEKMGRVLDLLEGVSEPRDALEAAALAQAKQMKHEDAVLGLYDRLGGAVKLGDRKVALGTFFDFAARTLRENVKVGEDQYEDQYVLVRKQEPKGKKKETVAERMKRLERTETGAKDTSSETPKKTAKKTAKK